VVSSETKRRLAIFSLHLLLFYSLVRSLTSDARGIMRLHKPRYVIRIGVGTITTMTKKSSIPLAVFFLFFSLVAVASAPPSTMRLDYYHTGNASQEMFSLDRVVIEPLPWPGNPQKNIDETNLGKYLFEVRDRTTNRLLYSRGFASIYGEWETTDEAKN